jgi:hypothetical protein
MTRLLRIFTLLSLSFFGETAAALVILPTDTGWYTSVDGGSCSPFLPPDSCLQNGTIPGNVNFLTGFAQTGGLFSTYEEHRSFFVFDLSGLGAVSNAVLRAYLVAADNPSGPGYMSPDATETLGLFDVSTNPAFLVGGTGGVNAFPDLGTGVAFGQTIVSADDMGSFIEVTLNPDALASIGAAGGLWAVGGRLLTGSGPTPSGEYIFGFSHLDPRVELVVTPDIPAPATAYLLALAVGALYRLRRGQHKHKYPPR